jgi:hypothetical protein
LGAVPGGGVGQVDAAVALTALAAIQIPAGQHHLPRLHSIQTNGQGAGLRVQGGDGAASAVGDAELADGVAAAHHPIPNRQLEVLDLETLAAETTPGGQQLLAGSVEPVDLAAAVGQQHHILAGVVLGLLPGLPPVGQQGQGGGRLGLRTDDSVAGAVGGHRLLNQAATNEFEGLAFPGLLLAAVLSQLGGAEAEAEGAEAAAGVDRRQLPVIPNQHHLRASVLGVVQEAAQLAAAEHPGLVHRQHRPPVQPLPRLVKVDQQPVAGGHLLEPFRLQAHGGDPGGGTSEGPVAVQLPGMPGDPEGEGLAGPGPPHHHRHPGAAQAEVADHPGLVLAGGRVRLQRGTDGVMADHGGLLAGAAGRGSNQPLLDPEELRGGPAALLQRPLGHHGYRPLDQEPVGQLLELGPGGTGQLAAEGGEHVLAGERGRLSSESVRAGQPLEHLGHRPLGQHQVAVACPAGHLPDHAVRILAALSRLGAPASRQRVRGLVLLGLAGGVDGPLDQPRGPRPPGGLQPLHRQVDLIRPLGEQPNEVLGHALELPVAMPVGRRPRHPERPDKLALVAGTVDGVGGQPMPVQIAAVQGCPAAVRPLRPVGHHQVGMQQGVALPGGPVVEPHR